MSSATRAEDRSAEYVPYVVSDTLKRSATEGGTSSPCILEVEAVRSKWRRVAEAEVTAHDVDLEAIVFKMKLVASIGMHPFRARISTAFRCPHACVQDRVLFHKRGETCPILVRITFRVRGVRQ